VSIAHAISRAGNFVLHEGAEVSGRLRLSPLFEANKFIYYDSPNSREAYSESVSVSGATGRMLKRTFLSRERIISSMSDKDVYCDVNPYGYSYINHILNIYPDAKFIHLVRNGLGVVRSYMERGHTYPDVPERKYSTYASGKPRPYLGDPAFREWPGWRRIQKASWFWKFVNEDIESRLCVVPKKNKVRLRIEDLDSTGLKGALQPLGVCCDNISINILNKGTAPPLVERDRSEFFKICAPLMKKYGYTKDEK
jgi:hypothetical protein